MMEWTRELPFSRSYLMIVIAVAVVVGGLAVFGQSSTLALAAAILGLYVLHLFSNWQLASNQRQQWQTLREVERMLGALDREQTAGAGEGAAASGVSGQDTGDGRAGPLTAVGEEERAGSGAETTYEQEAATPDVSAETPEPRAPAESGTTTGAEDGGSASGDVAGATEEADEDTVLVPRQYKLGTVAVVERVLTPGEVARVLAVQDRHPDRQFGDIAVDLDLLTEDELKELLKIQRRGLYRPEAISHARRDLKQYRRQKAQELGTGP